MSSLQARLPRWLLSYRGWDMLHCRASFQEMELSSWTLCRWIFWMSNQTLLLFRFSYSLSIRHHLAYGASIVDYQSMLGTFHLRADSFARSNSTIEGWSFHHFQLFGRNIRWGTLNRFEGTFIYFSIVAGNIDLFILTGVQWLVIYVNVLSRSSVWNSIGWAEIAWIFRLLLFGYVAAGGPLHLSCRLFANLDLFIDSDFSRHQSPLSFLFPLWLCICVFKSQLLILDKFFIHRFTLWTSLFQLLFEHLFQKRIWVRGIELFDASTKADFKLRFSAWSIRYWPVRTLFDQRLSLKDIEKMPSVSKGVLLINIVV